MGDVKSTDLKMARHEIARHPIGAFSASIHPLYCCTAASKS